MDTHTTFGSERKFELHQAILLYRESGQDTTAATVHDIRDKSGQLIIEPGNAVTLAGLEALANALGKRLDNSILPERILSISMSQMAWYCPSRRARIWFKPAEKVKDRELLKKLNGKFVQHPPLLFIAADGLRVLALDSDGRPNSKTPVYRAPYFNLSPDGFMCEGSARLPNTLGPSVMEQFENAFFNSAFSHSNWGHKITSHPRAHAGLWQEMTTRKSFPQKFLVKSSVTAGAAISKNAKLLE